MTPSSKRSILHGLVVLAACAVALTLAFSILISLVPEFTSEGTHRARAIWIMAIASGVVLATVPLADWLFRRMFPDER